MCVSVLMFMGMVPNCDYFHSTIYDLYIYSL